METDIRGNPPLLGKSPLQVQCEYVRADKDRDLAQRVTPLQIRYHFNPLPFQRGKSPCIDLMIPDS
jgi:hypothetical protein